MARISPIQVQKHLKGIDYPFSKEDLLKYAQDNGADDELAAMLEELPDEDYETPADVSKAIGETE